MKTIAIGTLLGTLFASFAVADGPRVVTQPNLVFAEVDGVSLELDLHIPQADSPPPLVVWIHGGGWRGGSRKKVPIKDITREGFAVASISYRLTDKALFPAQIHDCKAAVRWLRANAQNLGNNGLGYNADWIAVAGSSAGGHLALLMGTSGDVDELEGDVGKHPGQSSSVQAIIDYYGPSDFVLRGKTQPDRAYTEKSGSFALLGGLRDGKLDPEMERMASPVTFVSKDDPPLLVFHGTNDQTVLLDQSNAIVNRYKSKGLDAKLVVIDKAGHGGAPFFQGDPYQTLLNFLNENCPSR